MPYVAPPPNPPYYDSPIPIEQWTLVDQSNPQIVGSVVFYTPVRFLGVGGAFRSSEVNMLRNVFSDISGTIKPNDLKFGAEM